MAVSFIDGGNRRKPPTCHKSLINFIINNNNDNDDDDDDDDDDGDGDDDDDDG
jgi:hypothetical protein